MNSNNKSNLTDVWQIKKISWLFNLIASGGTPPSNKEEYYQKDIAWLNTGDLTDGYVEAPSKFISNKALEDFSTLKIYPKNSLVMAMYGATIGKLGITKFETTTNQACCVLSQPNDVDMKFMFYWLMGHREEIIQMSQGGGQPNISQGIIKAIRLAIPTLDMQRSIVAFLDKKFNEINQLISEKERLIQLLEEKRQAIITEAVTKGLNPNVKLKDSGVEWIGEIPEHWQTTKVKNIFNLYTGGTPKSDVSEYWDEEGITWITPEDLSDGKKYIESSIRNISELGLENSAAKLIPANSLVISTRAPIGNLKISKKSYSTNQGCKSLSLKNEENNIEYYYYLFYLSKEHLNKYGLGTTFLELSSYNLNNIEVIMPPKTEQEQISLYLQTKDKTYQNLISKIEIQIQKLKEYRQSLIYEAVTGKIDVRDIELDS